MPNIIRVQKTKDYFVASNKPFNDENLSFGARGILAYILSKPDDWEIRSQDLYRQSPAGRAAIDRMIRELIDNGYMRRDRENDDKGYLRWVTVVYEDRNQNPDWEPPNVENQAIGENQEEVEEIAEEIPEPIAENQAIGEPIAEKTTIGKPSNILSTENTQNTKTTPKGVGEKPPKSEKQKASQEMFGALTSVCRVDLSLLRNGTRGKFNQAEKKMREKGYKPTDIKDFGDWWYSEDWRGKQDQPPTLEQVRDCWGQFLHWRKGGKARASPNGTKPIDEDKLKRIQEIRDMPV